MATSKDDLGHDTKLEGQVTVNTGLYRHFPPALARKRFMLPSQFKLHREDKSKPTKQQRWMLVVAIAHEELAEAEKHAEYYAEQIRDSDNAFWPLTLRVIFVGVDKQEIVSRLGLQQQAWELEHGSPAEIARQIAEQAQKPKAPSATEVAAFNLQQATAERTEVIIPEAKEIVEREKDDQRTLMLDDPNKQREGGRKLLYAVLYYAIEYGASDIHVEWFIADDGLPDIRIRIRIDGVLCTIVPEAGSRGRQLLNILAVVTGANGGLSETACHVAPSNGGFPVKTSDGRRLDCRIALTPVPIASTTFNAVVRIQDMSKLYRFDDLGLSERSKNEIRYALDADRGMIVVNGPTGSGKNVTVFACMLELDYEQLKIFTVENPIELRWPWFHQCQVDERDESKSPAAFMRAAMRCDPDVIMVAEVRDKDIANVAISAVNSGHLVFTTVHAQEALKVPDRLIELSEDRPAVANTISLVIAQRLFRRPVEDRWVMTKLSKDEVAKQLGFSVDGVNPEILKDFAAPQLRREYKLRDINNYRGRIGVHEVIRFDDEMRHVVRSGGSSHELFPLARNRGMVTLVEDALEKAKRGLTTLEEIRGLRDV